MLRSFGRLLNVPKGFGKFYPKGMGGGGKGGDKNSRAGRVAGAASRGNSGGGGRGGSGGKNDFPGGLPEGPWRNASFGMLLTLTAASLVMASSDAKPGREISWQEFQSQLLESGLVDRIVVTNKNMAKVQLRAHNESDLQTLQLKGANEIGSSNSEGSGTVGDSTSAYESSSPFERESGTFKVVGKGIDSGKDSSSDNKVASEGTSNSATEKTPAKYVRYPRLGSPNNNAYTPYYFAIGSVESFERKLEEAQRSLGISPRDFIPVMYVNETSWMTELVRFGPTIALVAAYFFISRNAGGMMGGGPNNVFKIGKSTAKKINKEMVTATRRRGRV